MRDLLKEKPELLDRACKIYEEKLFGNTFVSSLSTIKGTVEMLQRLSKKYVLCVATGLHPKILRERVMPKFNIPQVFSQVISTYDIDDVEKHKPHPFMVEEILRKQKITPKEAIVVGDAKGDVLMAIAAGVTPVVVLTGHLNRKEAEELNVAHVIDDVTKLEDVLAKLK